MTGLSAAMVDPDVFAAALPSHHLARLRGTATTSEPSHLPGIAAAHSPSRAIGHPMNIALQPLSKALRPSNNRAAPTRSLQFP